MSGCNKCPLKIFFLFLLLFFISNDFASAQPVKTDTDSTNIYREIDSYSKRNKLTRFIYRLFLRPVPVSSPVKEVKSKIYKKPLQRNYRKFEGKIIRYINIISLDPFGYSVADTLLTASNFLFKAGNALHVKSQHMAIRNLLLIRQNKPFDSLLVKESERLIRSQRFVHDVSFNVVPVPNSPDSVDINIRELDNWSIIVGVGVSPEKVKIKLADRNFLGFGHESSNSYSWYHTEGKRAYDINYYVPNIRNTYINASLYYNNDEYRNYSDGISIDRPFFSSFTKWAGGISLGHSFRHDSVNYRNEGYLPVNFSINGQDFWAGNSNQLFKGNSESERTVNLISAVRFSRTRFADKPEEKLDSMHVYSNEDFYLASIGISVRKYVQDKYIFNYGVTEDVPVGRTYGLTGGYQYRNNTGRTWLGLRYGSGNYFSLGYFSYNLEYGTFLHRSKSEQGVLSFGLTYFTELLEIGSWKFRQFIKPQFTAGLNRFPYESININNGNGIRGFSPASLTGTKKIILTLQTQSYAPWNILGFQFGPYFIYSFGILGNDDTGFRNSHGYSQFAIGLLIKNEYLVFNFFQVSLAFYPVIPESGENIFKYNPNSTTNFSLRDFNIEKPAALGYQ